MPVLQGDSSADLDYYDQSSFVLPDNATVLGEHDCAVNLTLPPLGYAAVYRLGTGSSLSANKDIVIDTSPPVVVRASSINRTYTNEPAKILTLTLSPGLYLGQDRELP